MLLTEIANKVIIESGQFGIGSLSDLDLSLDRFWLLTNGVLGEYNTQVSLEKQITVTMTEHTFTLPFPLYVSSVVPNILLAVGQPLSTLNTNPPVVVPWIYDLPTGRLAIGSASGSYEVRAHYAYPSTITKDANGILTEVDIPDLTNADVNFFSLLLGKFMIALGRSRRAFTLTEIPIDMDAADLVSEGTILVDESRGFMEDKSDWAYGAML